METSPGSWPAARYCYCISLVEAAARQTAESTGSGTREDETKMMRGGLTLRLGGCDGLRLGLPEVLEVLIIKPFLPAVGHLPGSKILSVPDKKSRGL